MKDEHYNTLQSELRIRGFDTNLVSNKNPRKLYINGIVDDNLLERFETLTDDDFEHYIFFIEIKENKFFITCRPRNNYSSLARKRGRQLQQEMVYFFAHCRMDKKVFGYGNLGGCFFLVVLLFIGVGFEELFDGGFYTFFAFAFLVFVFYKIAGVEKAESKKHENKSDNT